MTSPPSRLHIAARFANDMPSDRKRTEPSPKPKFAPPSWKA